MHREMVLTDNNKENTAGKQQQETDDLIRQELRDNFKLEPLVFEHDKEYGKIDQITHY